MDRIETPSLMEPLLPPEGNRHLEDLAVELVSVAAKLAGKLANETILTISDLVRTMNCYYSNLIEGHDTHPVDIERALLGDYSKDAKKRNLQLEAFAHIEVQKLIDDAEAPYASATRTDFIVWLHTEFCRRMPQELLVNLDPITKTQIEVQPGELRSGEVLVGKHLAPIATAVPSFMQLFEDRYNPEKLSKLMRVIAVAASHHRLLWIHPFFDGNGRVARLFSHAFLKEIGIGSGLWSVSRGLARFVHDYKMQLAAADAWRTNDTDGRGSLSLSGLTNFCEFFLGTCIDQVKFMESLLEPTTLTERVRRYCTVQIEAKKLPRGSFEVIRELILSGTLPRGRVSSITGYQERQSRTVTAALLERGLLKSASPRADLKLHIPHEVVESWFPKLYPA